MKCALCFAENADGSERCGGCGRQLGPASVVAQGSLGPGSILASRYEIRSLLGRGGMGIVYKAHDRVLDETVALKVLLSEVAEAPEMAQRFRSEIKLARRVRHRNVCAIHEWGEDGPLRFITMEFIEGTDLKHLLLRRGALAPQEAFDVTIQVAEGLQAIHDVGVVHRDLKTSNVMLDQASVVRLMDFGIAKQLGLEASPAATAVGHILGTPEYMSPEQARGAKIDFRSDIYAVGVIVYEVFTGHVPFHGITPIATLFKQLEEPLRIEGLEADLIPPAVAPVLREAMAKEASKRYQSARELADALREARARTFPAEAPARVDVPAAPKESPQTTTLSGATLPSRARETVVMPATSTGMRALRETPARTPAPRPARPAATSSPTLTEPPTVQSRAPRPRAPAQRSVLPWLIGFAVVLMLAAAGVLVALRAFLKARSSATEIAAVSPSAPPIPSTALAPSPAAMVETAMPAPPTPAPQGPTPLAPPTPPVLPTDPSPPKPTAILTPAVTPPRVRQPAPPSSAALRDEIVSAPSTAPPQMQPVEEASAVLQMRVTPWAEVSVDGAPIGTTPIKPLSLTAGVHTIRLTHPDYKPLQRRVTLRPGETTKLEIDLTWEAFPKNE